MSGWRAGLGSLGWRLDICLPFGALLASRPATVNGKARSMIRSCRFLCLAALLALSACPASNDRGQVCKMTGPTVDGGSVPLPVSELNDPTKDYISLGSAECDDLVCVRSALACTTNADCPTTPAGTKCNTTTHACEVCDNQSPPVCTSPYPELNGNPTGYCTSPCTENNQCNDYQGKKTLECRQMLPSGSFLDTLKSTNPDLYNQTFGSGASSRYCLKRSPDAGQ